MGRSVKSKKHVPMSRAKIEKILQDNPSNLKVSEGGDISQIVGDRNREGPLVITSTIGYDTYNTLHPEVELKCFLDFLRAVVDRYNGDVDQENLLNQETQDMLHLIELGENMNASRGYRAYKKLSEVRRARRLCKNEIELLDEVYRFATNNSQVIGQLENVLGKTRAAKETIESRSYTMRTEIANNL